MSLPILISLFFFLQFTAAFTVSQLLLPPCSKHSLWPYAYLFLALLTFLFIEGGLVCTRRRKKFLRRVHIIIHPSWSVLLWLSAMDQMTQLFIFSKQTIGGCCALTVDKIPFLGKKRRRNLTLALVIQYFFDI